MGMTSRRSGVRVSSALRSASARVWGARALLLLLIAMATHNALLGAGADAAHTRAPQGHTPGPHGDTRDNEERMAALETEAAAEEEAYEDEDEQAAMHGVPPFPQLSRRRQQQMMADQLSSVAVSYWQSTVLYLVAKLRIADEVAVRPAPTCEQLAERVRAYEGELDSDIFCRIVRAAAAMQLFAQDDDGRLHNTPTSELLRSPDSAQPQGDDGVAPPSLRSFVLTSNEETAAGWRGLLRAVHTGGSGFEAATGQHMWAHLAQPQHKAALDSFQQGIRFVTESMAAELLRRTPPLGTCSHFCDVGGGEGALLAAFLSQLPHSAGTLFELPAVLPGARRYLHARGLDERTHLIGGDFFAAPTEGAGTRASDALLSTCDCVLLKNVLHDWNDTAAQRILQLVQRALALRHTHSATRSTSQSPAASSENKGGAGRVFIFELLLPEDAELRGASPLRQAMLAQTAMMDLNVLAACGGRERTLREYRVLLEHAGLAPLKTFTMGVAAPGHAMLSTLMAGLPTRPEKDIDATKPPTSAEREL